MGEVAHQLGLVPVAWLTLLHTAGVGRGAAWWWIAAAYGISWLADTAAHVANPWLMSSVYPVAQAALVGAVFLSRREARLFLGTLVTIGTVAALWHRTPDLLLHTVAWLGLVGILWPIPAGGLRRSLLVMFGLGWLAWVGYNLSPGWPSWLAYQGVRLAAIGIFCGAAWTPRTLRLV